MPRPGPNEGRARRSSVTGDPGDPGDDRGRDEDRDEGRTREIAHGIVSLQAATRVASRIPCGSTMRRCRGAASSAARAPPIHPWRSRRPARPSAMPKGREYLDAAGGAIVVNVGHGRREIADVMADQAGRLAYAHGSAFTTEPLEAYARAVAPHLPVDDPAIYPVSGGSRRSRPRSSSPVPTTSPAASRIAGSSTRGGGATTATPSGRSTCPVASRCAGRTKAGSAGSVTCRRPTRTGPTCPARTPSARPRSWRRSSTPLSRPPSRERSRRSLPSPSSARPSRPSNRRPAIGRPSPRCVPATASCSSPTR